MKGKKTRMPGWRLAVAAIATAGIATLLSTGPARAQAGSITVQLSSRNLGALTAQDLQEPQGATNLALSAAMASDSMEDSAAFGASRANDNNPATRWDDCPDNGQNGFIAYTWAKPVTYNKIVVFQAFDRLQDFTLQYQDAMGNWQDIQEIMPPNVTGRIDINRELTFLLSKPITSTGFKLNLIKWQSCASIWEMQVFNVTLGSIAGHVTDPSGKAVSGATVAAGPISTMTDASGAYTLPNIEAGTVALNITAPAGFKSRNSLGIQVPANGSATRDVTLFPLPTNLAMGAMVTDSTEDPNNPGTNAVDGDLTTFWNAQGGSGESLTLAWSTAQTFNNVVLREQGDRIREVKLRAFSTAKNDFVDVSDTMVAKGITKNPVISIDLPTAVTTAMLEIDFVNVVGDASGTNVSLFEAQVFNSPLGAVSGKVVDLFTGNPVAGASVTANGTVVATADTSGAFSTVLDANDYALTATQPGFFPGTALDVTADPNKPAANLLVAIPKIPENLALKATATASSEDDTNGYTPDKAIDGDLSTYWSGTETSGAGGGILNSWFQLTWPAPVTFNRVIIVEFGDRSREIDIQPFDPTTMAFVTEGTAASPGGGADIDITHDVTLPMPVTTNQLKIAVPTGANAPRFREVEVYNYQPPATPPGTTSTTVLCGDLNGNGKLDVGDATVALRIAINLVAATDAQKTAACNHSINVGFATLLLRAVIGVGPAPTPAM